jgi:hypothetical protein
MKTKYRILGADEAIKLGDQWAYPFKDKWEDVNKWTGDGINTLNKWNDSGVLRFRFRRPVPKTLSPYIKLRTGDKLRKGDEYRCRNQKEWQKIVSSYGEALEKKDILEAQYRRPRVTKPVVEVKTSEPVAKPVEKIEYRILAEGEVATTTTDQWKNNRGVWEAVTSPGAHGMVVGKSWVKNGEIRRPIRMQDATHRYLDIGEKLIEGDQFEYRRDDWMGSSGHYTPYNAKVGDSGFGKGGDRYRRKITSVVKKETTIPDVKPVESKVEEKSTTFTHELKLLIKKYTLENGSDTPDYILAKYLANCLKAFDGAVKARTEWYSKDKTNV